MAGSRPTPMSPRPRQGALWHSSTAMGVHSSCGRQVDPGWPAIMSRPALHDAVCRQAVLPGKRAAEMHPDAVTAQQHNLGGPDLKAPLLRNLQAAHEEEGKGAACHHCNAVGDEHASSTSSSGMGECPHCGDQQIIRDQFEWSRDQGA